MASQPARSRGWCSRGIFARQLRFVDSTAHLNCVHGVSRLGFDPLGWHGSRNGVPMARQIVVKSVLYPVLAAAFLAQLALPLARVATTYKVIDLDLSAAYVGLISATYALLPAMLAIPLGRFYDRGDIRIAMLTGATIVPPALLALLHEPASVTSLVIGTVLLGVAQGILISILQLLAIKASGLHHRDRSIGRLMICLGIGGAAGPLSITVIAYFSLPLGNGILVVCLVAAAMLWVALFAAARASVRMHRQEKPQVPMRELARVPKLLPLVLLGSAFVTTQDLLLVFIPVLGVERGIDAGAIGLMLSLQSAASILSRVCFGWLVARLGRVALLLGATVGAAVSVGGLAVPTSVYVTAFCLACAGISLSLALACSIALVVQVAPPAARATALSMRYAANRLTQFAIPLGAGLIASSVGVAGIFLALGLMLTGSAVGLSHVLAGFRHKR
ncbi:MFS transporter [Chelativorans sp. AA-79]|uniref:MFS transporter n=1 Tax=Chelativorans sp. AA-79 TaxID=3028735 RepID=UPI0023F8407D|nr:MFS transporter [Chelativorans sp. AA-79]WEX12457.1 MFS transporter [Chelativorans sp. AA-79]